MNKDLPIDRGEYYCGICQYLKSKYTFNGEFEELEVWCEKPKSNRNACAIASRFYNSKKYNEISNNLNKKILSFREEE